MALRNNLIDTLSMRQVALVITDKGGDAGCDLNLQTPMSPLVLSGE